MPPATPRPLVRPPPAALLDPLPEDFRATRRRMTAGLVLGLALAAASPLIRTESSSGVSPSILLHGVGVAIYGGLLCARWRYPFPSPHAWAFILLGPTHALWAIILGAILALFIGELAPRMVAGANFNELAAFPLLATGLVFSLVVCTASTLRATAAMLVATAAAAALAISSKEWHHAIRPALDPVGLCAAPLHLALTLTLHYAARRRLEARHRPAHGLCAACGYDLKSLTPPRCPECGTTTALSPSML